MSDSTNINDLIHDLINNYKMEKNNINQNDEYQDDEYQDDEYQDDEYNVKPEEIDINDYIPAEEEIELSDMTGLLNIFTCYFKQLFEKKQNSSMFESINILEDDSTNRCLESLYEEMFKFNKSLDDDKDLLYDVDDDSLDINNTNELYMLSIDGIPIYVSKFLLPLLKYLATQKWNEIEWTILPIKN